MTYDELQKKTAELYASGEVYTSPDFQCDQTGGFPTSLCVCWEQSKAWLELNENLLMDRLLPRSVRRIRYSPMLRHRAV